MDEPRVSVPTIARAVATDAAEYPLHRWQQRLHTVIFESDTAAGKVFDITLLTTILCSIAVVMLESIPSIRAEHLDTLVLAEWVFTILFTIEYALRLLSVRRPLRYARSFFGIVDMLAVVPAYVSLFVVGAQYLLVVRILRLLRIFRILKLIEYLNEASVLREALWSSRRKISVFLLTVMTVVVIAGTTMYVVEGETNGFTSIPLSIYWAVVTLTTVGYGDLAPLTPLGKALSVVLMLLGYGIIAVPTGIVSAELGRNRSTVVSAQACPMCSREGHDPDARHCKYCGSIL